MKVVLDTAKILQSAIANLEDHYTLSYVAYDDGLTDDQIRRILAVDEGDNEVENEILDTASDNNWYYVRNDLLKVLVPDSLEREALKADSAAFEELFDLVRERDDSNLYAELIRVTGRKFWRYSPYEGIPESIGMSEREMEAGIRLIAWKTGLSAAEHHDDFMELIDNAGYGGSLQILWHGDTAQILNPVLLHRWGRASEAPTTITWTRPHLLIINTANGSGHEIEINEPITRPFDPSKVELDHQTFGYGWDQICGLAADYYRNDEIVLAGGVDQVEQGAW